jgi:3-dehydroquinate synthase
MRHTFRLPEYNVELGPLSAFDTKAWIAAAGYSKVLIVADTHTAALCLPYFFEKTGLPESTPVVVISAGEQHKILSTCEQVWQGMFDARLDRKALVINLGGGVIGDLGGFCAATFKRGVDFVQVPTTLLSMTDAAVGGKLGIDFNTIKNAVGVFQNPAAVWVDPHFLQTLSYRELRSGFAEVIKHALIGDTDLWRSIEGMTNLEGADWFAILKASIAVKVRVVTEDPLEKGLRAILNYGHTIGHAIESYYLHSATPLTHGEAIAEGMIAESHIAYGPGIRTDAVTTVIRRFFPPVHIPAYLAPDVWQLMQQDKKNANSAVRMGVPGDGMYDLLTLNLSFEETEAALLVMGF